MGGYSGISERIVVAKRGRVRVAIVIAKKGRIRVGGYSGS